MSALAAELIVDDAALDALWPEWEHLWLRAPDASPFQSPAWLRSWWENFGTFMPRVAVLRGPDSLAGLLPLYILDEGNGRKLLPIGAGITDYQDALLAPDAPNDALAQLLEIAFLTAARDGMLACDLIDIPPDAHLRRAVPPSGWQGAWRAADPCPVLCLPGSHAELTGRIPAATRRKLRMNRHRLERIGGYRTEIAAAETLPRLLDALLTTHESRWSGLGAFADPRVRSFHQTAAPRLLAAGMLRLQVLWIGDQIASAYYALLDRRGRVLFYLSGFDSRFAAQSPGSVLMGEMIEAAVCEAYTELHFLRGGERYKYAWGAADRMNAVWGLERR